MPLLGALIGNLLAGLAVWLAKVIGTKVSVRVVAGASLLAAMAALMAVFNTQVAPLAAQAFSTQYGAVIGLAFPPIAGTCLATIVAVWLACATYRLQVNLIKLSSNV